MTEIYHYNDNVQTEYNQRIMLNKTSCLFCEIDKKEILIKCNECEKLFCNGSSQIPKSHIIFHLQKSSHKIISLYPFDKIVDCEKCKDNNIFNLYLLKTSNENKIFCKDHIPNGAEDKAIPFIGENCQIDPKIVPLPSTDADLKRLKETNINEMDKRENLIEDINYVANRFLNKIKDKYTDEQDYYIIHKPLILCELEYARKICENKKSYSIRINGTGIQYRKRPLFSFKFNQSHSNPFKIGSVYKLEKANSDLKSLGLIVNIDRREYFLIPIDKKRDIIEEGIYTIKEEFNSVPYDRMIAGLDMFFNDNDYTKTSRNLTNYILGRIESIHNEEDEVSKLLNPYEVYKIEGYGELNSSQKMAINNTRKHVLNLIQGPPGTGKTFTASFLIYNILLSRKNMNDKILVCAPTNAAADNLALALLNIKTAVKNKNSNPKQFNILRVVARTREFIEYDKKVQKISLQNLVDFDKDDFRKECKAIIDDTDIVITTCSTSMIDKLEKYDFKFVVIDETTQSPEVETLLPILKGSRHVTLIGDPQQLSPTILHPKGKQTGMHITLFERIMKIKPEIKSLLNKQYRMHPKIAEFISLNFYNNELTNGVTIQERTNHNFNNKFNWPNKNFPIIFINVEGREKLSISGTSYYNHNEYFIIKKLLEEKFPNDQINNTCIITPYLGQKEYLETELNIKIEISSIDSFQGKEKDFIIINTVRNNKNNEIGFLKDMKRLNVSISRAKYGLIIVGNANCLYNSKIDEKYTIWKKYIDYLMENNALMYYDYDKNTFEKFVVKMKKKEEKKDDNQKDDEKEIKEEENYDYSFNFDTKNNNYNTNWDLINKDCRDNINDKFYYNPIKTEERKLKKKRNYYQGNNYNHNHYYYNNGGYRGRGRGNRGSNRYRGRGRGRRRHFY